MKLHYTYEEAAEILGVSASWLVKHKEQLHRREQAGHVYFRWEDLVAISDDCLVLPAATSTAPAAVAPALLDLKPRRREQRAS